MATDAKVPVPQPASAPAQPTTPQTKPTNNYKGFVAGVFSGVAKLAGNPPFYLPPFPPLH